MQTTPPRPPIADLVLLDSVISAVIRSERLRPEDADDFRQTVHLRIAERNGEVYRRFNGRSSLRTYLVVVVRRMLLDWRNQAMGKWRTGVVAKRLGPQAMLLERLIHRDGYTVDEAIEHVSARCGDVDPRALRRLAEALPTRRRPRFVAYEPIADRGPITDFDDPIEQRHREQETGVRRTALARALAALSRDDRRLIWLRYLRGRSVPALAALFGVAPPVLYRRSMRLLLELRRRLVAQQIGDTP